MGLEGTAAAAYWDMVVRLLNNYTFFEGRERQGAKDLVNCMLNYGYGILYGRVWEAVIRERLNPHISYLHVPADNKPTLAFDLIEEFRQQVVDRAVIALISKGEEVELDKGQISPATKKRLVEKVLERLNNHEKFRGRELRMSEIIRHQAHALAVHLQGGKTYKPYVARW
jgi:CRISPR-associated endonuclease Cas1